MKFLIQVASIALLGYLMQWFLPWWTLPALAFGVSVFFLDKYSLLSFLAGFLGGGLLWGVVAFLRNASNQELLAGRTGALFGDLSPLAMILITAILGGLLAGMGALTGNLLRKALAPKAAPAK